MCGGWFSRRVPLVLGLWPWLAAAWLWVSTASPDFVGVARDAHVEVVDEDFLEEAIRLTEEWADIIDRNQGNCGAMAEQLDVLVQRNEPFRERFEELRGNPEITRFVERNRERFYAASAKMAPLGSCVGDPRMVEVLNRLQ